MREFVVAVQAAKRLDERNRDDCERVLSTLANHGGFMTLRALRVHAGMTESALSKAVAALEESRDIVVEDRALDDAALGCVAPGPSATLTACGQERDRVWRSRYDQACSQFAAPLSASERQQLVNLLFKLQRQDCRSK